MHQEKKSVYQTLFDINVNKHVENKNGLNYLSWAIAWGEVKQRYPMATYRIYETEGGCIYFTDGRTCWVKTGVTINALEHIEYLPVMDHKNRSISLENVTSFDVNKSIQRSLTKALARHGLGLYIYAGEDLPSIEIEKIKPSEAKILKKILHELPDGEKLNQGILKAYKVNDFRELSVKQYAEILDKLRELEEQRVVAQNMTRPQHLG